MYVARVLGRFPEPPPGQQFVVADVPLDWDPVANLASAVPEAGAAIEAAADGTGADAAAAAVEPNGVAEGEAQDAAASPEQQDVQQQGEQQHQQHQQQGGGAAGEGLTREERKRLKKQQRNQRRAAKADRQEAAAAAAAAAAKRPGRSAPKPALTEFKLLAVAPDGRTSLVECRWAVVGGCAECCQEADLDSLYAAATAWALVK